MKGSQTATTGEPPWPAPVSTSKVPSLPTSPTATNTAPVKAGSNAEKDSIALPVWKLRIAIAVLIHKDPEFESVSELQKELLPYK